ncbi:MAG: NAD(P)/FAD-dependent oxidoreductase [Candidatus Midichloriaceae bacterium]|jgi:predicted Rossmann fold flavoprotein|nr:NAD(P)/FAD-dependent oxidoreductase [Candidatus Midichloriaceae bacterium]
MKTYDVIIIGCGAAGMMAAMTAGQRGKKVLLLDHSDKVGEKIRISGGGRCNFTNINATYKNYLSQNPHFAISALAQYSQHDFIKLVESHGIEYHEKTLGQLFCDGSSKQIIDMLMNECKAARVEILLNCMVNEVKKNEGFVIKSNLSEFKSHSLIIATGGLSIPKLGSTDFGYRIAKQFGIKIVQTRPALVPLTFSDIDMPGYKGLSGVSLLAIVSYSGACFKESVLFTHRGLSGPAILQISSYIEKYADAEIKLNLTPDINLTEELASEDARKVKINNFLKSYLPNRFVDLWCDSAGYSKRIADFKQKDLQKIVYDLDSFKVKINGTEGYAKAEVTAGGVDTKELSSKTMEALKVPNLYFIGEVVDVTGWLGGYNFQWAWSSGFVAGSNC